MSFLLFCLHFSTENPNRLSVLYNASRRNVALTWGYPYDGNRPVTRYTIFFIHVENNRSNRGIVFLDGHGSMEQGTKIPYVVDKLRPYSKYNFSVTATNDEGNSPPSTLTMIETNQDSKFCLQHFWCWLLLLASVDQCQGGNRCFLWFSQRPLMVW